MSIIAVITLSIISTFTSTCFCGPILPDSCGSIPSGLIVDINHEREGHSR